MIFDMPSRQIYISVPPVGHGLLVRLGKSQESALDSRDVEIALGVVDRLHNAITLYAMRWVDENRLSRAIAADDGDGSGFFVHDCLALWCE